jgi:signal transduction histidine kinase
MSLFRDGSLLLGAEGELRFADKPARSILECPEVAEGTALADLCPDSPLAALWAQAQSTHTLAEEEFTSTWTRKPRILSLAVEPCPPVSGYMVRVRDLTALRRLEAIERDFITNVSHELRTPLTSIKMAAESLQMGAIGDQKLKDKFLSNIQREADRLTRLVNELIVLANVQDAETALHVSQFGAFDLLDDVVYTMSYHSRVNDIELVADFPENLPMMLADRDRLSQVLINLVDNAIKCNRPNGSVTLHAHQEDDFLVFQVVDTGIGIPHIDLPRIFDRFFRVDKARSRVTGGTGLGLSIVKDIVEAHGGTIEVDSTLNVGTTFTLRLPLKARPPQPLEDAE